MPKSDRRKRAIHVLNSKNGRGVFAQKAISKDSVIGKVSGVLSEDDADQRYVMELDNDLQLNPKAPFRYLNHSCNPNSELFMWDDEKPDPKTGSRNLYVGAKRAIREGAELTIDYAWTADFAIPCNCGSSVCRGWIVWKDEAHLLSSPKGKMAK